MAIISKNMILKNFLLIIIFACSKRQFFPLAFFHIIKNIKEVF